MEDSEVIRKIQQGDETALDYLYKKHYKMMLNLIMKNNGSEDEAKDIFQDSLIVFWQKAASGNLVLTSRISTYLYSICQNLWRKELERKAKFGTSVTEKGDDSHLDIEKQERINTILKSIDSLGDTCRQILTYHYFDKFSMQKIAELMGFANADTVKSKKYKCKQELEKMIKAQYKPSDFLD
jgi:RNA polymerase sigma factor (sigma-70 family)